MSKKAQTVQGLKCLKSKLFWLKSAVLRISIIVALELHSMRAARSTPVRCRARLECSALFFYTPLFFILDTDTKEHQQGIVKGRSLFAF